MSNQNELELADKNGKDPLINRESSMSNYISNDIIDEIDDESVKSSKSEIGSFYCCELNSDNVAGCVLNVITSALGAGCLTFSYILDKLGFILAFIIFFFVSITVYYSNNLLINFVVDQKYFSFALLTNETLGKTWMKIYAISSLIYYSITEIRYLTLIYQTFTDLVNTDNNYLFSFIYFLITMIIEIFICSYIFNPKKIHSISLIVIICFIIILLIVIIGTVNNLINGNAKHLNYNNLFPSEKYDFLSGILNIFSFIIEYLYGFSYNSSLPTLLGNMKNLDNKNSKKIHLYSFLILCLLYIVLFFFGYLICENTDEYLFDSMDMFGNNDNIFKNFLVYFCKTIFWFYLFIEIPMRFIVIRDNYSSLVKERMTPKKDLLATIICIFLFNLIVVCTSIIGVNNLTGIFIELFGGIFGVIICFCLPVIIYATANGKTKLKSIIGYILIGFYGIVGLITTGNSFFKLLYKNYMD